MTAYLSVQALNQFYGLSAPSKEQGWSVDESYAYCRALTTSHYENFPVGSMLVPKKVRPHVYAIYAFARVSDDFADEAVYQHTELRLRLLDEWQRKLDDA